MCFLCMFKCTTSKPSAKVSLFPIKVQGLLFSMFLGYNLINQLKIGLT